MMWQIAERGDERAAADFCNRFPTYSKNMANRMRMVGGLKQIRSQVAPTVMPRFGQRYAYRPKPLWVRYGPAAVSLAVLASASFYITQNFLTPLPLPDVMEFSPIPRTIGPVVAEPAPPPAQISTQHSDAGPHPFEVGNPLKVDQHFTAQDKTLREALDEIAGAANLSLQISPGFPNPTIESIDIKGPTALDLIKQLGAKYKFSAFDEGGGHVLIIPAVEDPATEQP